MVRDEEHQLLCRTGEGANQKCAVKVLCKVPLLREVSCPEDTHGATAAGLLLAGRDGGAKALLLALGEGGPQRGTLRAARASASRATGSSRSACPGDDGASNQADTGWKGRRKEGREG